MIKQGETIIVAIDGTLLAILLRQKTGSVHSNICRERRKYHKINTGKLVHVFWRAEAKDQECDTVVVPFTNVRTCICLWLYVK